MTGVLTGLLIGAGVIGHALRLVNLKNAGQLVSGRAGVALAAMAIYGGAAFLVGLGHVVGLIIAIVGPIIGITAIIILPNAEIDAFQIVLGIGQLIAWIIAIYLFCSGLN